MKNKIIDLSKEPKFGNHLATIILLMGSLIVVYITIPIWQHQNLNDDSFITLTYAKNLVMGNGFVYNHPPATLGTTTPLFTFMTALLAFLTPFDVVEAAIVWSVLAWIGVGWLLYVLLREIAFQPIPAAIASSVPLLLGQGWRWFVGMEIWVFQFFLVLSIYLVFKRKLFLAGVAIGALFLTRGEGALMGIVLFGYLWFHERKIPIEFIIGVGGVIIIWIIYAMSTFGTFIPNTLAAKQAQAHLPSGRNFIERMMTELLPNYIQRFDFFGVWFINPFLLLAGIGGIYISYYAKRLSLFLIWGIVYLGGYTLLNPQPYYWYMFNIVFVLLVLVGVGIAGLITFITNCKVDTRRILIGVVTILLIGLLFSFSVPFIRNSPNFFGDTRSTSYKSLSMWLNENTQSVDSVAFIEIGYLGYFTNNRIIDLAGLIDPETTKHISVDGFTWAYWHYQPDYYIFTRAFNWALGDIEMDVKANYEPVAEFQRSNDILVIYKRK